MRCPPREAARDPSVLARVAAIGAAAALAATSSVGDAQEPPPAAPVSAVPTAPAATVPVSTVPAAPAPTVPAPTAPAPTAPASAAPAAYPPGPYPYPYPPGFVPYRTPYPLDLGPLPETLPYQEGRAIPPGYRLERRVTRKLAIPGISILGGMWLGSVVAAAVLLDQRNTVPLFFPVAGPFITLHTADVNPASAGEPTLAIALIFDGVAQTAGAALVLAGLLMKEPILVLDESRKASLAPTVQALVPKVAVGPGSTSFTWQF